MLRRTLPLFVIIALLASCNKNAADQAAQAEAAKAPKPPLPAGSTDFKPASGTFSIYMPAKPQEQTQTVPETQGVSGTLHMYVASAAPMVYMVEDTTMNKDAEHSGSADEMLKGVESGFTSTSGTTVVHSNSEKILGYPGRRMEFGSAQLSFKGFSIVAGKHNFIVIAGGPKGQVDDGKVKTFCDSFRVEDVAAG